MNAVLYIDDQEEELQSLRFQLADRYRVSLCVDGRSAASLVKKNKPDAVVIDIQMPGYDGFRVLSDIQALPDPPPILMLSGYPEDFFVVRALREGASDFLSKPYSGAMVRHRLDQLIAERAERLRSPRHGKVSSVGYSDAESDAEVSRMLPGDSPPMREIRRTLALYARSDAAVLILGESGTGKDLAARALHRLSERRAGPFVIRNTAALTESLVESELFGCEDGAFTSAKKREGCFESAHGGTLFLDEIADAGNGLQASLLRVVEDGVVRRIGSNRPRKVDCRLVFATNKDLEELASRRLFRQDLLYRISTLPLKMPALRSRPEDIPFLVSRFLAAMNRPADSIEPETLRVMTMRDWPGNVRQLKACVERAIVLAAGSSIRPEHLI